MKHLLKKVQSSIVELANDPKVRETIASAKENATNAVTVGMGVTLDAINSLSNSITDSEIWREFNQTASSELVKAIGKAMDAGWEKGGVDPETLLKFMPDNHRILDEGHTIAESFEQASEVGAEMDASFLDTFLAWGEAYLRDLSSPAGMPMGEWADSIYAMLRDVGVDESVARDLVTVNGSEALSALMSGTISSLALVLAWNVEDRAAFSKAIGSMGVASLISANPITGLTALVGLGIAYQK